MSVLSTILEAVGGTPMVRLQRLCGDGMAEVLVKAESFNPSGSIKARPALRMVQEAEKAGLLGPGATIVEASSGNQGIAMAMIGAVKGYKVVVFMPETMSVERRLVMQAYGAEVRLTPSGRDFKQTLETCLELSQKYVSETPGAFHTRQFENVHNCRAHEDGTAWEILEQTGGRIDVFVSGIGTGGTITGVGRILKREIPGLLIVAAEPTAAPLVGCASSHDADTILNDTDTPSPITGAALDCSAGFHAQEGIGDGILPGILDKSLIDRVIAVTDDLAVKTARRLAREEGLFCGISSGSNVFAALVVAKELGCGGRVVTVLPDGGEKYLSTLLCRAAP